MIDAAPAFLTHRASGDAIVVLFVLVALACVAAFGFEDDYALHGWAGLAAAVVVALKVGVVRSGSRVERSAAVPGRHPVRAVAVTWLTVTPDFLAGED